MKIEISFPSVAIGLLAGIALPTVPLASMGFLAYSWGQVPAVAVSALVLGTMGYFVMKSTPVKSRTSPADVREHLRKEFPVVPPASINWLSVEASMTPQDWFATKAGGALKGARAELERQLTDPVDEDLVKAILAALKASEGRSDYRWGINELARRMWDAHQSETRLDLAEYMSALRKKYPKLSFSEPVAGSPFPVIQIIEALKKARAKGGIIPAADFLWLRLFDRRLWYVIDNVGRRTFHIEGLGVMAHYQAQEAAGKVLSEPHVEGAVRGLKAFYSHHGLDFPGAEEEAAVSAKKPAPEPSVPTDFEFEMWSDLDKAFGHQ